jgi:acetyl esterase/lipase
MITNRVTDWDDAYANRAHVPEAEAIIDRWPSDAAAYRAAAKAELDIPYGPGARGKFDLFLPEGTPKGLAVFIHGGYWMMFDKSFWSHYANGAARRGWAVAMPSYTLAPEARIGAIGRQIAQAITAAAKKVDGPIAISGHSAGGQLAARMMCADAGISPEIRSRISHALPISGVHDLRPIMATAMNDTLHIDAAEAAAESPALLAPAKGAKICAWVGLAERPEFVRQNALLANVWTGLGAETRVVEDEGRHHFDVIAGLTDPDSPIVAALTGW